MVKVSKTQKRILDLVDKLLFVDDSDLLGRNIPLSAAEALCDKGVLTRVTRDYGRGYTKVVKANER